MPRLGKPVNDRRTTLKFKRPVNLLSDWLDETGRPIIPERKLDGHKDGSVLEAPGRCGLQTTLGEIFENKNGQLGRRIRETVLLSAITRGMRAGDSGDLDQQIPEAFDLGIHISRIVNALIEGVRNGSKERRG